MDNNQVKRAAIYAVSVMAVSEAHINNVPGISSIRVQGAWHKLAAAKIEYAEKGVNDGYDVSLKIRITNTSAEQQQYLLGLHATDIICRLHSTDCMDRVLGSGDVPVNFTLSKKGLPQYFVLEYRGVQPEMAKLLQSF